MKSSLLNIIIIQSLIILTSSCSTNSFTTSETSEPQSIAGREIASEENCFKVMRSILSIDPRNGKLVEKDVERMFTRESASSTAYRQEQLSLLERLYKKIDSLLDFRSKAHIPINDSIKIIDKAEDGLLAKIMLVRKAKKSIDLTYFLFDDSEAAQVLLHELRLAAKRGVKIRIMYDPVGSKLGTTTPRLGIPEDLKALADLKGRPIVDESGNPTGKYANIEIVQFNPMWKPNKMVKKFYDSTMNLFRSAENQVPVDTTAWNNRIHDKILLIDAEDPENSYLMTGGRNLNNSYYHLKRNFDDTSTEPTTDIEVILKGSSYVSEDGGIKNDAYDQYNRIFYAMANFNITNYVRETNAKIMDQLATNPDKAAETLREVRKREITELRRLRKASREVLGYSFKDADGNLVVNPGLFSKRLKEMEAENFLDEGFEKVEYALVHEVHNLSGKSTLFKPFSVRGLVNDNSIQKVVFEEMLKGKSQIDIISPYFWIDEKQTMQLVKWLKEDPSRKLKVVSNSFLSTDNLISQVVVEDAYETMTKLFKEQGVFNQTDLRVIGKEDDELLEKSSKGKEYGFLHAKVYMVDNRTVILSTSNLDPISRITNSEVGVRITFPDDTGKNVQKMREFVKYVTNLSTNTSSDEYQRMLADPDGRTMLRKLAIFKTLARNLGLLHLL